MLIDFKNSQTSIILRVKLRNSSLATGAGLTGLTSASANLVISTIADNEAAPVTYTQAGATIETIAVLGTFATPTATKCRFKEVDAVNHPGVHELQFDDARFAVTSAKSLLITISGATNLAECDVVIPLRGVDPYNAANFGLSDLVTAAANVVSIFNNTRGLVTVAPTLSRPVSGSEDQDIEFCLYDTNGQMEAPDAAPLISAFDAAGNDLSANLYGTTMNLVASGRYQMGYQLGSSHQLGQVLFKVTVTEGGKNRTYLGSSTVVAFPTNFSALAIDSSGHVVLSATGLNLVLVDGYALPTALQYIASSTAGKVSGAGSGTETFKGLDGSTTRLTFTVDSSGNRTGVAYS